MEADPNDVRRLNKALRDLAAMTGKTVTRVMKGATVQAARSAAKHTRGYTPGKKRPFKRVYSTAKASRRKLRRRNASKRQRESIPWWARYQIRAWQAGKPKNSQNEILLYARTESSRDKMRRIPNKGVAKRAWIFALKRLGNSTGMPKPVDGIAKKYNDTKLKWDKGTLTQTENINTVNASPLVNALTKGGRNARIKKSGSG